jgi:hypothetical protein
MNDKHEEIESMLSFKPFLKCDEFILSSAVHRINLDYISEMSTVRVSCTIPGMNVPAFTYQELIEADGKKSLEHAQVIFWFPAQQFEICSDFELTSSKFGSRPIVIYFDYVDVRNRRVSTLFDHFDYPLQELLLVPFLHPKTQVGIRVVFSKEIGQQLILKFRKSVLPERVKNMFLELPVVDLPIYGSLGIFAKNQTLDRHQLGEVLFCDEDNECTVSKCTLNNNDLIATTSNNNIPISESSTFEIRSFKPPSKNEDVSLIVKIQEERLERLDREFKDIENDLEAIAQLSRKMENCLYRKRTKKEKVNFSSSINGTNI